MFRLYFICLFTSVLVADEGMWLYSNPPLERVEKRYGFRPSREWLDHVQQASVRLNNGGSGSFVSPDGLVMTNHHVASECIAELSTKERDLMKSGFHAKSHAEEKQCPGLELNVLDRIEDVTAKVNSAASQAADPAAAQKARTAAIGALEKESTAKTGLRSDVVTLYNGGQYHLYLYKKYTDVRLVFAPELAIAFFGGDPDNFEFPRYNLDVTFVRVYDGGKPATVKHWLKWSRNGAREGDVVFVSGHPGKTDRLRTVDHLQFFRDFEQPLRLEVVRRRELLLSNWSRGSAENARRAQDLLMIFANSRKARSGMLAGLQDPAVMSQKAAEQQQLTQRIESDPKLKANFGGAWKEVSEAVALQRQLYREHYLLEMGQAFAGDLFGIARHLLRSGEERAKPNASRLLDYTDARLESLQHELFSTKPIYKDLETVRLADSLSMMAEWLGGDHPLVVQVLAGKSPRQRAADLIAGTSVDDVATRKKLYEGGQAAVAASTDPLIQLARLVDAPARKVRATVEQKVEEPLEQAYGKIAQARFAVHGASVYPDATFTLRLAYGEVKGYEEEGKKIPPMTTMGGAYAHAADHGYKDPFDLPESWKQKKGQLDLNTPFNFVSTADIIGGNSGSPTINRHGEVVGLIFDGNIYSLVLDYAYTDVQARAVSVHSQAIVEALRKIYGADALVSELTSQR
ncbi:MAG TPA: S46 family peptidase [Bryobacteraceae bacterium]|nr:S46 family peptidase [Bryobacteraceae bacterium]